MGKIMIKTQPDISFHGFLALVKTVTEFRSVTGKEYSDVKVTENVKMSFVRKSSGKIWAMDLMGVHQAYLHLTDFRTKNFREYVPRTHSPALGLLLEIGLLKSLNS